MVPNVKKQHILKMSVAEMRMLRYISGNTRNDRIRNEEIFLKDDGKSLEMIWSCSNFRG